VVASFIMEPRIGPSLPRKPTRVPLTPDFATARRDRRMCSDPGLRSATLMSDTGWIAAATKSRP
jgi:hypothetical protein